jgi:hypothetical protein
VAWIFQRLELYMKWPQPFTKPIGVFPLFPFSTFPSELVGVEKDTKASFIWKVLMSALVRGSGQKCLAQTDAGERFMMVHDTSDSGM